MILPQVKISLPPQVGLASEEVHGSLSLDCGSHKVWEAIRLELEESRPTGETHIRGICRLQGPFGPQNPQVLELPFRLTFRRPHYPARDLSHLPGKWGGLIAEGLDFLHVSAAHYRIAVYLEPREGEAMLLGLFPVNMVDKEME